MENPFNTENCVACGEPLIDVNEGILSEDPLVKRRKTNLQSLFSLKEFLSLKLENLSPNPTIRLDDDSYPGMVSDYFGKAGDQVSFLTDLLLGTSYFAAETDSLEFQTQLFQIEESYKRFFDLLNEIATFLPPPTWEIAHDNALETIKEYLAAFLDFIPVLESDCFKTAFTRFRGFEARLIDAGKSLPAIFKLVTVGKFYQVGLYSGIAQATAFFSEEVESIDTWQDRGWVYFSSVFEREIKEIPQEHGMVLAMYAIVAQSLSQPALFRTRVQAVTSLIRMANRKNSAVLKPVWYQVEEDIIHATNLLLRHGQHILATDFSRLHEHVVFDIAVRTYHRMSEGAFKHLLALLLFCEEVTIGNLPNYADISKRKFGKKVGLYHKPKDPIGIAQCSDNQIALMANDLVMYVRHADAHCDFDLYADKIFVYERDLSGNIVNTYNYTLEEFEELLQRLSEAVSAILVGVICFQIEHFEDYLPTDLAKYSNLQKLEFCKFLFAMQGIVVDSAIVRNEYSPQPVVDMSLVVQKTELPLESIVTSLAAVFDAMPSAIRADLEIRDADGNYRGKLSIPAEHYRNKIDSKSRIAQMELMNFVYKIHTQYADRNEVFGTKFTSDDWYLHDVIWHTSVYLNLILEDLERLLTSSNPIRAELNTLSNELALIQKIATTNQPFPNSQRYQADLLDIVRKVRKLIRDVELSLRGKKPSREEHRKSQEKLYREVSLVRAILQRVSMDIYFSNQSVLNPERSS